MKTKTISKNEILKQLPRLTPRQRKEIRVKLDELDGVGNDEWDDDGELTDEEKALILDSVADLESNPQTSIPWRQADAWFRAQLKK